MRNHCHKNNLQGDHEAIVPAPTRHRSKTIQVCVAELEQTLSPSLLILPQVIVGVFGCGSVVSSLQTAGGGDEPLDWLYQTPADDSAETEQISQVRSNGRQMLFLTLQPWGQRSALAWRV